jgi:uncharacterized protein Yka (UPF0111/DUF47 family)
MQAVEEAIEDLRSVSDRLADAALQLLSRALDTAEEHERRELATLEKRVTKARRAVEKAIAELSGY